MDLTIADILQFLTAKVFNQAGLVAVLLFWGNVYQAWDKKSYRKENNDLHEKILTLAVEQTKTNAESNNVLDKIIDMLTVIDKNGNRTCHYRNKE